MAYRVMGTVGWLFDCLDRINEAEQDVLAQACPTCLGAGEVRWNPGWPDPQCEEYATCPDCAGTGDKTNA